MLTWLDILKFASQGTPNPPAKIVKTEKEWKSLLTEEQYYVTRKHGTERPFSSDMCSRFEPGKYGCVCCHTPLFDSAEKFDSGTGWPSFTQPLSVDAVAYHKDYSHGMYRVEALCNTCDAHLGHVFQDGPKPGGLRYCINAVSLKKEENNEKKVVFGGGCFWCTEAIFQQLKGVLKVESGYSGGIIKNPMYKEVISGLTGHAEVIQITYDASLINFEDLIQIHLTTHDPTTLNQQGADRGTQYRSIIFYTNEDEKARIIKAIDEIQSIYSQKIVTEVTAFEYFYRAEQYHQDYYNQNSDKNPYCTVVINPKLKKFKELYKDKLLKE
ncbi:MAG: bifunctional methionine sulfoxide reductase B/A protein [Saprospiraceae bacterium]